MLCIYAQFVVVVYSTAKIIQNILGNDGAIRALNLINNNTVTASLLFLSMIFHLKRTLTLL